MSDIHVWFRRFYEEVLGNQCSVVSAFTSVLEPSIVPVLLHDFVHLFPQFIQQQRGTIIPQRQKQGVQFVESEAHNQQQHHVFLVRQLRFTQKQASNPRTLFLQTVRTFEKLVLKHVKALQKQQTGLPNPELKQHPFFNTYVTALGVTDNNLHTLLLSDKFKDSHYVGLKAVKEQMEQEFIREVHDPACTQTHFMQMINNLTELKTYSSISGSYHYSSPFFTKGHPRLMRGPPPSPDLFPAFNKTEVSNTADKLWLMLDWVMQESVVMHEALRQFITLTRACEALRLKRLDLAAAPLILKRVGPPVVNLAQEERVTTAALLRAERKVQRKNKKKGKKKRGKLMSAEDRVSLGLPAVLIQSKQKSKKLPFKERLQRALQIAQRN